MTKRKTPASNLLVPQSQAEAASCLARIGELSRRQTRIETELNDATSRLTETAQSQIEPLREELVRLTAGLQVWADANRAALTGNGRTKTADLGTGLISWRLRPPRVTVRAWEDTVMPALLKLKLERFVRTKQEPNKEAMLAEPELARSIAGITIGTAGEDFVAEPKELELATG